MGEASKSVQEASKTALEASKTAAGVSKNTLDDLTYVGKSTFGDLTKSAKEAAAKKGLLKVGYPFFFSRDFSIETYKKIDKLLHRFLIIFL